MPAAGATRYLDRADAGHRLAERVRGLLAAGADRGAAGVVVLGLARGGVEVAAPVAAALDASLGVLVVRKVARRDRPELGLGALTGDGPVVWDDDGLQWLGLTPRDLAAEVAAERAECARRLAAYGRRSTPEPVRGRTAVVVDDGVATGVTALAGLRSLRADGAARLVLAAPVVAAATLPRLLVEADEVVALQVPELFGAVSRFYVDFAQTADATVVRLLTESATARRSR